MGTILIGKCCGARNALQTDLFRRQVQRVLKRRRRFVRFRSVSRQIAKFLIKFFKRVRQSSSSQKVNKRGAYFSAHAFLSIASEKAFFLFLSILNERQSSPQHIERVDFARRLG